MSRNWQNLRVWNGSQNKAFEELCCQLARCEKVPPGSTFVRKADPDAGVECYWKLPNGDELGWQAKFFLFSPNRTQWQQLDESVKRALEKHPRLTSYTICLPIDRPDPRINEEVSFMDKWTKHVEKWKKWVQEKRMSVQFPYWGEHEIWERLTKDKHVGRRYFWFNEEEFNTQWAKKHIKIALADAGERYAPHFLNNASLNVKLPMANLFEGLGRTDEFWSELRRLYGRAKRAYSKANRETIISILEAIGEEEINSLLHNSKIQSDGLFKKTNGGYTFLKNIGELRDLDIYNTDLQSDKFHDLQNLWLRVNWRKILEKLLHVISNNLDLEFEKIDLETIAQLSSQGTEATWMCVYASRRAKEKHDKEPRSKEGIDRKNLENYSDYRLSELIGELQGLNNFVQSPRALLVNKPAILLVGDALVGKTHLFCDIALERIKKALPTILILGQHLMSAGSPWNQLLEELGLSCTREQFIGALDAWGQAKSSRVLLIIDALNEGNGKVI